MSKTALRRRTDLSPAHVRERPRLDAVAAAPRDPSSDGDGFALTYRDHHDAVLATARRVCGPHQAADVAQDVFLVLSRHPEKFDPARGSLRAFLLAIAHHRAVDVVRSEKARQLREGRVEAAEGAPADVDEDLLRGEGGQRVRAALAGLPAPERDAIVTAFYGRCSYREAALRLGQPEGTIKSRIRSGLQRLHPLLIEPVDVAADGDPGRGEALARKRS